MSSIVFTPSLPEHNHETVHEVCEVPPGQLAVPFFTDEFGVVFAEELHSHDGEDEDDDAEDEGEVGEGAHGVGHDGEDVVEGLPRLGQLEHSEQTEGSEHGQAFDALGQKLDQGQRHDQEVKAIPAVLKFKHENK